jgi:hypothetical protein
MDQILQLFRDQGGYLNTRQLSKRSQHYHLKELVDQGEVIRIKPGLYQLAENIGSDELGLMARIVPKGIFCLFSAWAYWELTTQVPLVYHMAIENKNKIVIPEFPPVKLYFWQSPAIDLGVLNNPSTGGLIRIFNKEKSVCDAIRFRNKIGMDLVSEILKKYLSMPDKNLDLLVKYAGSLRILKPISEYLSILI